MPAEQLAPPWLLVQAWVQLPQCNVVLFRSTSQPSTTLSLQSANPDVQLMTHLPASHEGVSLFLLHTLPQPPQLVASAAVLVRQAPVGSLLQFLKPGVVQDAEPQVPLTQACCDAVGQTVPHTPQLLLSEDLLTSQPVLHCLSQSR